VLYTFLAGRIAPDTFVPAEQHLISGEALLGIVGLGCGATVVAASATGASFPGVVYRPITEPNASVPVTAIWLTENDDPVRGRFVAMLRDHLKMRDRPLDG